MAMTVNIHAAKTHFSRLVQRAARGEEIIIARNGVPIAKLTRLRANSGAIPKSDPVRNLDEHGFEGPGSVLTNREIDQIVYGA